MINELVARCIVSFSPYSYSICNFFLRRLSENNVPSSYQWKFQIHEWLSRVTGCVAHATFRYRNNWPSARVNQFSNTSLRNILQHHHLGSRNVHQCLAGLASVKLYGLEATGYQVISRTFCMANGGLILLFSHTSTCMKYVLVSERKFVNRSKLVRRRSMKWRMKTLKWRNITFTVSKLDFSKSKFSFLTKHNLCKLNTFFDKEKHKKYLSI